MEKRSYTITGCRPTQFAFKYNEQNTICKKIKRQIEDQAILLYGQGVRTFLIKGALGVDLWAGEILLQLSDRPEFVELEIALVLPCEECYKNWDNRSKKRMESLRSRCRYVTVLGSVDWPLSECYRKCVKYMVNQSDGLLIVCDPDCLVRDDAATMIKLAQRKNISITCILPDTGKIISLSSEKSQK